MSSLERFGATKAILMSGFLFGLMHFDFQKLLGTFLLGVLIGFIVYRTNSIFAGMMAHFTNNAAATGLGFLAAKLTEKLNKSGINQVMPQGGNEDIFSVLANAGKVQMIFTIIVWVFMALGCMAVITGLLIALWRNTKGIQEPVNRASERPSILNILWMLPGIAIIGLFYYMQGLKLLHR